MTRVYLDTSAYLALLLGEPGTAAIAERMRSGQACSSVLLVLESMRTLARLGREGLLTPDQLAVALQRLQHDAQRFELRSLTLDLCLDPTLPAASIPRSLDLAHLRSARWFHRQAPLGAFLTLDQAQRQAARELGLPVP